MMTNTTTTTPTTTRRATHAGTCQACGRIQKLPHAVLAQHGYTVAHGFFSGVCQGAGHPPFEVSCALVAQFIERARVASAGFATRAAVLRAPATEPVAWVHNYERHPDTGMSGYVWRLVDLQFDIRSAGDSSFARYFYMAPGTSRVATPVDVRHGLDTYGMPDVKHGPVDQRLAIATHLNARRADPLDKERGQIERYIAWQTERVRTWVPAPLVALPDAGQRSLTSPAAFQPEQQ